MNHDQIHVRKEGSFRGKKRKRRRHRTRKTESGRERQAGGKRFKQDLSENRLLCKKGKTIWQKEGSERQDTKVE